MTVRIVGPQCSECSRPVFELGLCVRHWLLYRMFPRGGR